MSECLLAFEELVSKAERDHNEQRRLERERIKRQERKDREAFVVRSCVL